MATTKAAGAATGDQTGIDLTQISAAAAAGAAQGAEIANHLGLSEDQFARLSALTMNAAAAAASKVSNDLHERRRRADRLKEYGTTAAISTVVFVAGTAAVAGYQRYRNNENDNNRGRNEG